MSSTRRTRWNVAFGAVAVALSIGLAAMLLGDPSGVASSGSEELAQDAREARLEAAVRVALLEKLRGDGLRIAVEVRGTEITLSGTVKNRASQELAEEVTLAVGGVREVHNLLRLDRDAAAPSGPVSEAMARTEREVADGVLESRVKLRLLDEMGSNAFRVEVEATDGVVSLRGALPTARHRQLAVEIASATKGVDRVIDLVKVK